MEVRTDSAACTNRFVFGCRERNAHHRADVGIPLVLVDRCDAVRGSSQRKQRSGRRWRDISGDCKAVPSRVRLMRTPFFGVNVQRGTGVHAR